MPPKSKSKSPRSSRSKSQSPRSSRSKSQSPRSSRSKSQSPNNKNSTKILFNIIFYNTLKDSEKKQLLRYKDEELEMNQNVSLTNKKRILDSSTYSVKEFVNSIPTFHNKDHKKYYTRKKLLISYVLDKSPGSIFTKRNIKIHISVDKTISIFEIPIIHFIDKHLKELYRTTNFMNADVENTRVHGSKSNLKKIKFNYFIYKHHSNNGNSLKLTDRIDDKDELFCALKIKRYDIGRPTLRRQMGVPHEPVNERGLTSNRKEEILRKTKKQLLNYYSNNNF